MNMGPSTPAPPAVALYRRGARVLHWLTVVLLALQFPIGLYMTLRGKTLNIWDATTNALYSSHKLIGVIILIIVIARLGYRLLHGAPADEPTLSPWQRIASHLNHWGLYALLIAVPLAGYVGISQFPALDLFGVFSLPGIASPDKTAADTTFDIHRLMAMALLALVALHVGAALWHHLVRRDNVLARMLPRLLRR
jgi:cytochrome b561